MKIIKPHPITDSMLVSSSVAENDYPAWVSGTTYALGARVIRASVHKVFERLVAGAGTVAPELDTTSPAVWMDIGPTKKWAPFDNVVGTLATGASPLKYTLRTGFTDSLALFELTGRYVDVVMKDGAVLESGTVHAVLDAPQHPYTQRLVAAASAPSGA